MEAKDFICIVNDAHERDMEDNRYLAIKFMPFCEYYYGHENPTDFEINSLEILIQEFGQTKFTIEMKAYGAAMSSITFSPIQIVRTFRYKPKGEKEHIDTLCVRLNEPFFMERETREEYIDDFIYYLKYTDKARHEMMDRFFPKEMDKWNR